MEFYEPAELERVLRRAAVILGVDLRPDGAEEIAGRSRGTPRIANRLLRRVRDFAEVRADGAVTREVARAALAVYDVDELGLDRLDRAVLSALVRSFGGGPVGVSTLAVAVGEEPGTVEEVCEPYLVRAGMLARTPRGRVATAAAWTHLGITRAARQPPRWPCLRCSDSGAGRLRWLTDMRKTTETMDHCRCLPLLLLLLFMPMFLQAASSASRCSAMQKLQSALTER